MLKITYTITIPRQLESLERLSAEQALKEIKQLKAAKIPYKLSLHAVLEITNAYS